jgi:hypothetical protein
VALEENVLELVAAIAQRINDSRLVADAPIVLELLHNLYRNLDPSAIMKVDEELMLPQARCARFLLCPFHCEFLGDRSI